MKTVWNVMSDNEISDYPTVQTFASQGQSLKMVQELFQVYCDEHDLDPYDPNLMTVENIANGKYYRFSGGDWEEWVYVMETEVTPSSPSSAILEKDI